MDYKGCKYYCQGYCTKGEAKANGVYYDCIQRCDCPEVRSELIQQNTKKKIEMLKNRRNNQ